MLRRRHITGSSRRQRHSLINDPVASCIQLLEPRFLLTVLGIPVQETGTLAPGEPDVISFEIVNPGRLDVSIERLSGGPGFDPQFTINHDGRPLISSAAEFPGSSSASVAIHLVEGSYTIEVTADGAGAYRTERSFTLAEPPFDPVTFAGIVTGNAFATADFNGDGIPDVAVSGPSNRDPPLPASVSILFGTGDGTWQRGPTVSITGVPAQLTTADVNGDGIPDLISANGGAFREDAPAGIDSISVLPGVGDGSFGDRIDIVVGQSPRSVLAADFNLDGHIDLVTANYGDDTVTVLLGAGDGTFSTHQTVGTGLEPRSLAAGDFTGDGIADLAVANEESPFLTILAGTGTGSFQPFASITVTDSNFGTRRVRSADLNGDGHLDLIAVDHLTNNIYVLSGTPSGVSATPLTLDFEDVNDLVFDDLNADGFLDIVTVDATRSAVDVRFGTGQTDVPFGPVSSYATGTAPVGVLASDLNGDGQSDLSVLNQFTSGSRSQPGVTTLLNANGSFLSNAGTRPQTGRGPSIIRAADLDSDGRQDLVTVNDDYFVTEESRVRTIDGDLAVLRGRADGTFEPPLFLPGSVMDVAIGDVNGDGRLDLVSVDGKPGDFQTPNGTITVRLGLGNGTFQTVDAFPAGTAAIAVVLADINADGRLDAVITDQSGGGQVQILEGAGDGAFQLGETLQSGAAPIQTLVRDLDGDGFLDVATANQGDSSVSIFWANGVGTFVPPQIVTVPVPPDHLVVDDFNRDGLLDLVVSDEGDIFDVLQTTVSILTQQPGRTFAPAINLPSGEGPTDLATGDFNRDGNPDLAIAIEVFSEVAILAGRGDGSFDPVEIISLDDGADGPRSLVAVDLNLDETPDLVTANHFSSDLTILLADGDGEFLTANEQATTGFQTGPLTGDINNDGIGDVITLGRDGLVRVRAGRDQTANDNRPFAPPFVLNPENPVRSIELLDVDDQTIVVGLDSDRRGVTAFGLDANGSSAVLFQTALPGVASRLQAIDLGGDGRDELLVSLEVRDELLVLQLGPDGFNILDSQAVGAGPGSFAVADFDTSGFSDVAVIATSSGTVDLLTQQMDGTLATPRPFVTTLTPLATRADREKISALSASRPAGIQTGDITGDGVPDLVVSNNGDRSLTLLAGTSTGFALPRQLRFDGLVNPSDLDDVWLLRDSDQDGRSDQLIAVLDSREGFVLQHVTADGQLRFLQAFDVSAALSGLELQDVTGDGTDDLLAGTDTGDLIIFPGLADGTFDRFLRADGSVPLLVRDVDGDGRLDVIVANSALDRVSIDFSNGDVVEVEPSDEQRPLAAPGDVELADLNGDNIDDLVVANSGGNEVLIFPGTGDGNFDSDAIRLFSGTNPTGVTIEDVNDDGRDDLFVANRGSNDVAVFLADPSSATGFDGGRRLAVGVGPVSTEVMRDEDNSVVSLLVTNADDGTLSSLPSVPGLSGAVFNDQTATSVSIGQTGNQGGVVFGNSFVAANPLDDSVFFIRDLADPSQFSRFSSLGLDPLFVLPSDFNFDGIIDLIVANSGDGSIVLFAGDAFGFVFEQILSDPNLAHPSSMDIAQIDGVLNLYVTDEGQDVVTIFEFASAIPAPVTEFPVAHGLVNQLLLTLAGIVPAQRGERPAGPRSNDAQFDDRFYEIADGGYQTVKGWLSESGHLMTRLIVEVLSPDPDDPHDSESSERLDVLIDSVIGVLELPFPMLRILRLKRGATDATDQAPPDEPAGRDSSTEPVPASDTSQDRTGAAYTPVLERVRDWGRSPQGPVSHATSIDRAFADPKLLHVYVDRSGAAAISRETVRSDRLAATVRRSPVLPSTSSVRPEGP